MPSHIDPHEALSRIRTIAGRDTISPLDLLMEIRVMLNIFLPEPHLQLRTGFCCGVSEECKADTPLVHCEDCGGVKPEEPHPTGTGGEQCDACERVARLGDDFYCSKHGKPKEAPEDTPKDDAIKAINISVGDLYNRIEKLEKHRNEEREFRKAILSYLALPNLGYPALRDHLSWQALKARHDHMRKRFVDGS